MKKHNSALSKAPLIGHLNLYNQAIKGKRTKGGKKMKYSITAVLDHYEVRDFLGNFVLSADTYGEAVDELHADNEKAILF